MNDQNPNDPLDSDAAELYLKDHNKFLEQATFYTTMWATNN